MKCIVLEWDKMETSGEREVEKGLRKLEKGD